MSLPYYPMYPTDFEADTSHLTLEEDGAYNRLLRLMWMTPGCSLPHDPAWITRRLRVTPDVFDRVVQPIISEFFKVVNGRVFSPRLRKEFEKVDETSKRRSKAGKMGGRPKAIDKQEKKEKAGFDFDKGGLSDTRALPEPEPEPDKKESGKPLSRHSADLEHCIAEFNAIAAKVGWPQVQRLTPSRRAALGHRVAECGGEDAWIEAIHRAALSPLLTGQTGRGWRADFDWLSKAANFTKLMEGNYDPRNDPAPGQDRRGTRRPHDSMVAAFAGVAADLARRQGPN